MPEGTARPGEARIRDPRRAEGEIRKITGVRSCRVVTDAEDGLLEIHVIAGQDRHPKQIIRDVETVCLALFDARIDHRKVSIAVVSEAEAAPEPTRRAPVSERIRFFTLRTTLNPTGGEVEVILARGEFRSFGKASFSLASGPLRAVAEATLQAVDRFVSEGNFQLGDVNRGSLGDGEAVFVHVQHVSADRSFPLLGSALAHRDVNLSALYATLNAVNRYVGRLEAAEGIEWVAGSTPGPSPS
ncbi:MAG: hypothetical protein JW958_06350 [Candidatus Eisenbacteria bacterium]|nr:hypothetical protein [Candidatus Eisenbacteria bacterium]